MTKIESAYKDMMDDVQMSGSMIAHCIRDKALELERELTAVTEQRDEINSMYHKIIKEVLECDPIPACKREDDQLEPPWEVIARIREQRDRLAEALKSVKCELGVPQPEYPAPIANAYWIADEALQSLNQPTEL